MNAFDSLVQADRRLVILQSLAEGQGYSVNEFVLRRMLDVMKHKISRDLMRTELGWLAEQGLVAIEEVEGVMVATLTGRGKDAAEGAVLVPGVQRPEPGI
ncbi:MAG: ArsR family transcriptional regulator [Desulfobulbaceae bacterium]|nr:ArsR family transcriptional regulator [Desulfobulbaceae bacterium]